MSQPEISVPRYFLFLTIGFLIWMVLSYFGLAMIDYQQFFQNYWTLYKKNLEMQQILSKANWHEQEIEIIRTQLSQVKPGN